MNTIPQRLLSLGSPRLTLLFWVVLVLYVTLRLIAWNNTVLLDDADSVAYLHDIDAYHSLDWDAINERGPDSTPFYPAMGALAKVLTGSTEPAARLVSFLFSVLLVAAVGLLTRDLDGSRSAILAMLILAVNGTMISLSVSVLTEASYIGTIYLGFYLLWRQFIRGNFRLSGAVMLAIVFGLAFLNRTEGIFYVAAIPMAIVCLNLFFRESQNRQSASRIAMQTGAFVLIFLMLAIPQVLHVSSKMGAPAINGRIAWQTLAAAFPDRSITEITRGLDLADDQPNILYIRNHYADAVATLDAKGEEPVWSIGQRIKQSAKNIDTLYRSYLGSEITPFGFALAFLGLTALYLRGAFSGLFYCLFLLAVLLIGPVAHSSVLPRHLSAAVPAMCMLQGIGLHYLTSLLTSRVGRFSLTEKFVLPSLVLALLAGLIFPLKSALGPPQRNAEYDPSLLTEPIEVLTSETHVSAVSAHRPFIAYFSRKPHVLAPFTTYDKLIRYLDANDVSHLYVEFDHMVDFPYVGKFVTNGSYSDDFERLWLDTRSDRPQAALFRRRTR